MSVKFALTADKTGNELDFNAKRRKTNHEKAKVVINLDEVIIEVELQHAVYTCIFRASWAKPRLISIIKVKTQCNVLHFD
jgi:hypothetical protein